MSLVIKNVLGATKEEIKARNFNIWLGISLGNKYLQSKNKIKQYVEWALENTKETVLVLIPGGLEVVNYEVLKGYSREKAVKLAKERGEELFRMVENIKDKFPTNKRELIQVVKWGIIEENIEYLKIKSIVYSEFEINQEFKLKILDIVKSQLGERAPKEQEKIVKLASYVLDELPILLRGINYQGKLYSLLPYPGLTLIDELVFDLIENKAFSSLAKKIKPEHKIVIVNAWVE
ncbi:MAG: tRNA-dependent cyclodipeptide synthase [archaeon]